MTALFSSFNAPGVRIQESTQGFRTLAIASFQSVYMIGSSASGDYLVPTQVTSLEDFTNQFGASPSEASVKLFFRNDRRGILYFVRTPISIERSVVVSTAANATYTVTIAGTVVSYVSAGSETPEAIASGILAAINFSAVADIVTASASAFTDTITVRLDDPLSADITFTVGTNLAVTVTTPTTPASQDYIYAIENSFDSEDDYGQGFILAPQAFQLLTSGVDRLAVANALHALASDASYDWIALIDAGTGLTPTQAQAEGILVVAPQGHASYYYPYLKDLEGGIVPPSAAVAGVATRRFKAEGLQQPAAGAKFPVLGVTDVVTKVNTQQQEVLNPLGINIIRNLRNKGVVIWAMRTRSNSTFYSFMPVRVIMSVLNGTLRRGFDNEVFTSIDGLGILLSDIAASARSVCSRFWRAKLLFGASEAEAFEVKCDFENNTKEDLGLGNVLLEVYAIPAPAMERLLISSVRVAIGTLPLGQTNLEAQLLPPTQA
ncbi:phage tail sheath subtilisin-like domain-containing protein [Nostoc sp. UHCC 0251]|uniref:phage tail sheath subtilisin-like domain-containing protein n=1 Tax=Nostoc sp. UHCC 0251 TaxID=3110240 RepID=UPI002B20AD40|nr:phage tail sheath subtilisin-like domain-containing protein [Nostoc sp. UHCC 0251]MEA5625314.1 phage tail sheath subtilisin-like domain-containing protein [Nostoc sp. UHCC 0251]